MLSNKNNEQGNYERKATKSVLKADLWIGYYKINWNKVFCIGKNPWNHGIRAKKYDLQGIRIGNMVLSVK